MKNIVIFLLVSFVLSSPVPSNAAFDPTRPPPEGKLKEKFEEALNEGLCKVYKKVDGRELKLWIYQPKERTDKKPLPAILFIHGGAWVGGDASKFAPQCLYFASRGIVAVTISYRLIKKDNNVTVKDCLADAKSAMRWLRKNAKEFGIDPNRIIASGGSAGGHLAAALACIDGYDDPTDDLSINVNPQALILFNPAFDIIEGWSSGKNMVIKAGIDPAEFSPAHLVKPGYPPTLVLSGEKDTIITPEQIRKFVERMKKNGNQARFIEYPDENHAFFNYGKHKHYVKTLMAADRFLISLKYLKGPPTITIRK